MKNQPRRVVITGIGGFIGKQLASHLRSEGYDVTGLDLKLNGEIGLEVELLNRQDVEAAFRSLAPYQVVIHLAAVAHGQRLPKNLTYAEINAQMTKNVVEVVQPLRPQFILASSIAVYGEDGKTFPVKVDDEANPATDYGKSKLISESVLRQSEILNWHILRICPVFDARHLRDVSKRVRFPGVPFRMRFVPSVRYSLCSIGTVIQQITAVIREDKGKWVHIVGDSSPYEQNNLLKWFGGPQIPVPLVIIRPIYWVLILLPAGLGRRLRSSYTKLFCSNIYITGKAAVTPINGLALASEPQKIQAEFIDPGRPFGDAE